MTERPTPEGWEGPYRPPVEQRWVHGDGVFVGRTEPGTILLRSRWSYSPTEPKKSGDPIAKVKRTWAFSRGAKVVRSDWPQQYEHFDNVQGHVNAAVRSFGDDADLVIEVRLARPEEVQ